MAFDRVLMRSSVDVFMYKKDHVTCGSISVSKMQQADCLLSSGGDIKKAQWKNFYKEE